MAWTDLFSAKPTIERFASTLQVRAAKEPGPAWAYVPEAQELRSPDGGNVVNLTNLFREYSNADRAVRPALLEKYVKLLNSLRNTIPGLWSLAQKAIFPLVRGRFDLVLAARGGRETPETSVSDVLQQRLKRDLVIRIGYDFGATISTVRREKAATWGIPEEEIFQIARRNLAALPRPSWNSVADGVYQLQSPAEYQESMLLRQDVLDGLPGPGDRVFVASNRGVLLGASVAEPSQVNHLLEVVQKCHAERPWPMSLVLLTPRGGKLEVYEPTGAANGIWRGIQAMDISGVYNDQKKILDELNQREGNDMFVASCSLMGDRAKVATLRSWCSWTEGVRALLPKTDLIGLGRLKDGKMSAFALVAWDVVTRVCPSRLNTTSEDPPRWRVDTFPDEKEWQELIAAAEVTR